MLKSEKASARARLFLRLSLLVEAFVLPLVGLVAFVWLASAGALDAVFPWGHIVCLFVLSFWFFYKLSYVQERLAHGRAFMASVNLNEHDLDKFEKQHLLLVHEWKRWPFLLSYQTNMSIKRFVPHTSGAFLVCLFVAWFFYGGELLARINPFFDQAWLRENEELTVWITPPSYMDQKPVIIAAPGGAYTTLPTIDVIEGSVLSARAVGKGKVPVLQANGSFYPMVRDEHGDFATQVLLKRGISISVSQGWKSLGFWHIRVKEDRSPTVRFVQPPEVSHQKTVRVAFKASDDFAIKKLTLVVHPTTDVAGIKNQILEIPLSVPEVPRVEETAYVDLTSSIAAGLPSVLQLKVNDVAGNEAWSERVSLVLPERSFTNPLARAIADERKQLLLNPDPKQRDEAAAVMAGIARQKAFYHADPLVLLTLRSAAMRLLFDTSGETFSSVATSLWSVAVRVEEGEQGIRRENLRKQLADLSAVIDEGRNYVIVEKRIGEVSSLMLRFFDEMVRDIESRNARNSNKKDKKEVFQLTYDNQSLGVGDLSRILGELQTAARSENWEQVRAFVSKLQRMLENVQPKSEHLSEKQEKVLKVFQSLRSVVDSQKVIHVETRRLAGMGRNSDAEKKLALKQEKIATHLLKLLDGSEILSVSGLHQAASEMKEVADLILKEGARFALPRQGKIVDKLSESLTALLNGLPEGPDGLPRHILGKNGEEDRQRLKP